MGTHTVVVVCLCAKSHQVDRGDYRRLVIRYIESQSILRYLGGELVIKPNVSALDRQFLALIGGFNWRLNCFCKLKLLKLRKDARSC